MAWVVICVPAGALAGVGLVEFNWGGPPYDGGFAGDLVLFGGFLAVGQAPFVAVFVWFLLGRVGDRRWRRYAVAVGVGVVWPLVGLVGWTAGSYIEVGFSTPLYSDLSALAGTVPWLVVGTAEGFILAAVLALVPASGRGAWRARAAVFGLCVASWVVMSVVGGLFYEFWSALDVAARSNDLNEAIGGFLESLGVAENVAYVVVPRALFTPILYGIPTGVAIVSISRAMPRWSVGSSRR